jgi:hypothetical protein
MLHGQLPQISSSVFGRLVHPHQKEKNRQNPKKAQKMVL